MPSASPSSSRAVGPRVVPCARLRPGSAAVSGALAAGVLGIVLGSLGLSGCLWGPPPESTTCRDETRADVTSARTATARAFDTVLLVSVDGLRSDALLALPRAELPAFARLARGTWTLNARTDPEWTITLPNHTAMLTGRFVEGPDGHGWRRNVEPKADESLHGNHGAYVASAFDVAHDRGVRTALFSGKPKFALYDQSYDATRGAPDVEGADDGRDKIDTVVIDAKLERLTDAIVAWLEDGVARPRFAFVHLASPDLVGHVSGWDLTPGSKYLGAVRDTDRALGRILDAIERTPALAGRTAIVLTADHGGGVPTKSHDQPHMWVDYVIPFFVWRGETAASGDEPVGRARDLYAWNGATRSDPGLWQVPRGSFERPPIRNGDAGNLSLALLGLPAIPGSTIGARQDLVLDGAPGDRPHPWPRPDAPPPTAPDSDHGRGDADAKPAR